ncbi:MAG: GerMN domain-containing protein [Anaerolineales bacterium]
MSVRPRALELPRNLVWPLVVAAVLIVGLVARTGLTSGEVELPDWLARLRGLPITLYVADPSDSYLVPVTRIFSGDQAVTPQDIVDSLSAGEWGSNGLNSPLPVGATIQKLSQDSGMVRLELLADFAEGQEQLAVVALAQSLSTLPDVRSVHITVNGASQVSDQRLLYFSAAGLLVAEPIVARTPEEALAAFLRGPAAEGVMGLPEDVRLLDYELNSANGLLSVNLTYTPSVRELAVQQPEAIRQVLIGLIATLTAFDEVEAVRLDFEGHARLGLGQCSDLLRAPQIHPQILNDERLLGG